LQSANLGLAEKLCALMHTCCEILYSEEYTWPEVG
jgi:hypothetical protein